MMPPTELKFLPQDFCVGLDACRPNDGDSMIPAKIGLSSVTPTNVQNSAVQKCSPAAAWEHGQGVRETE